MRESGTSGNIVSCIISFQSLEKLNFISLYISKEINAKEEEWNEREGARDGN